jgi:hypothetical protein
MDYHGFVVGAFEREPGKWRAKVLRPDGEPLIKGHNGIMEFVTGIDRLTASSALLDAVKAIDAETLPRPPELPGALRRHSSGARQSKKC